MFGYCNAGAGANYRRYRRFFRIFPDMRAPDVAAICHAAALQKRFMLLRNYQGGSS